MQGAISTRGSVDIESKVVDVDARTVPSNWDSRLNIITDHHTRTCARNSAILPKRSARFRLIKKSVISLKKMITFMFGSELLVRCFCSLKIATQQIDPSAVASLISLLSGIINFGQIRKSHFDLCRTLENQPRKFIPGMNRYSAGVFIRAAVDG